MRRGGWSESGIAESLVFATAKMRPYVGAFLALSLLDIKDTADSVKLIKKLDKLDDVTRKALKQSKRFGEKAFQNCDVGALNKIGKELPDTHAIEIFNMKNTTEVVETLHRVNRPKVMINLASLEDASQVPVALNFFPDNLNTNVIWLSVVEKPAEVISNEKYVEVFEELKTRSNLLKKADAKSIETYLSTVSKAFTQEELVIVQKIKDGQELPEIGVRLQSGAYGGFCKNEEMQQVFFTKLDEIAGKTIEGKRTPIENFMKKLGFKDDDIAWNMKIFDKPDGKMYLDVVVSRDKTVFHQVHWDDVEERFIKYVESMDKSSKEFKQLKINYPAIFEGNKISKSRLEAEYFNVFKSKEASLKGFEDLTKKQKDFFNAEIDKKFSINQYFTGQGFTATIDEGVFGTGEMVLESTGKETLPLCTENYVTYRYTVDKDCNFELFKIYDEVK